VTGRVVEALAEPLAIEHPTLTHVFPSMERLAAADPSAFPMPASRAATVQRVADARASGRLHLDAGRDRSEIVEGLCAIKGIGPWTAQLVVMRGLGDPDVFLDTDLVVRQALTASGETAEAAERWRPWRSYAMHHLWTHTAPALGGIS
jgi:AraC family transcriptional regulator of adaptative response / DNA-3-methyladenine glycosylase II